MTAGGFVIIRLSEPIRYYSGVAQKLA